MGSRLAMEGFSSSLCSYHSDPLPKYCGLVTKLKQLKLECDVKPTKNCPDKYLAPLKNHIHISQAKGKMYQSQHQLYCGTEISGIDQVNVTVIILELPGRFILL